MLRARYLVILVVVIGVVGSAQAVSVTGGLVLDPAVSRLMTNPDKARYSLRNGVRSETNGVFDFSFFSDLTSDGTQPEWFRVSGAVERVGAATLNASIHLSLEDPSEASFGGRGDSGGLPEPNTMILLGSGLLALAGIGRRFTRT